MAGTAHGPFTLLPGLGRRRVRDRSGDWATYVVFAVALVALLVAILSGVRSRREGLRTLPAEARTTLFTHTLDELRQFCGAGRPEALEAHCRELASFAAQFDECTGDCAALVRPHLAPRPTR